MIGQALSTITEFHSVSISQRTGSLRRLLKMVHHAEKQREFLGWVPSGLSSFRTEQIVVSVANGVNGSRLGDSTCRTSIPLYHFLTVVSLGEIPVVSST